jgi:hypothetical protein
MSFYRFNPDDIINTFIHAYPRHRVYLTNNIPTGSVFLEKQPLVDSTWTEGPFSGETLKQKRYQGYSERLGGFTEKRGPFTASITVHTAVSGGTNKELYGAIENLYAYHSVYSADYILTQSIGFNSQSIPPHLTVISVPEVYYDKGILTGSFTGSDVSGTTPRTFYDNGRGGIYSGSVSGTLIGNIFYSEGIVVLHASNLTSSFGSGTMSFDFRGDHRIPVKIFRCRAPAGELNFSTNPTFSQIKTELTATNRNEKQSIMPTPTTYITKVGIYNEDYKLVAVATLGTPIRKDLQSKLQIRIRIDF